jgi:hypothetical protein
MLSRAGKREGQMTYCSSSGLEASGVPGLITSRKPGGVPRPDPDQVLAGLLLAARRRPCDWALGRRRDSEETRLRQRGLVAYM